MVRMLFAAVVMILAAPVVLGSLIYVTLYGWITGRPWMSAEQRAMLPEEYAREVHGMSLNEYEAVHGRPPRVDSNKGHR